MNFFERELRKIVGKWYPNATYTGHVCLVPLTSKLQGKIQFLSMETSGGYDSIAMTVIDRKKGPVNRMCVSFHALFAPKIVRGRTQKPTIVYAGDHSRWTYGCKPDAKDYAALTNTVSNYLEMFMEQAQTASQQWSQSM